MSGRAERSGGLTGPSSRVSSWSGGKIAPRHHHHRGRHQRGIQGFFSLCCGLSDRQGQGPGINGPKAHHKTLQHFCLFQSF